MKFCRKWKKFSTARNSIYVRFEDRIRFFRSVIREADFIAVTSKVTDCSDPKDNKFLELAIDGVATHIISGDSDLCDLHPYRNIAILSPHDFLNGIIKIEL
ncbi:MAG: putative toxin-antitoxin system toxin component, PIN family [Ignavibacteriota bacterium]